MILSTYHPSVSAAPELKIRYPINRLEDEETIPRRTTATSFNLHIISSVTQAKVMNLLETQMNNEERIKAARDAVMQDPVFDPLNLYQRLTHGCTSSTNTLTLKDISTFTQRPIQDVALLFYPLKTLNYLE
jgi:hypothetical protein